VDFVGAGSEAGRVAALRRLELLDTPSDPSYDEIIALVSRFLATPIALVSLVDEERQWFKARLGLDATETPRDISFCTHAIAMRGEGPFEVNDALQDPRFSQNPLVTNDPSIRFYAGQPLRAPGGERIGTLCVIDRVPRTLDDEQRDVLRRFASLLERMFVDRSLMLAARGAPATPSDPPLRPAVHLVPRFDVFLESLGEAIDALQGEQRLARLVRDQIEAGGDLRRILVENGAKDERIRSDRSSGALARLETARRLTRVDLFRTLTDLGLSIAEIARLWGVSRQLVSRILRDGCPAEAGATDGAHGGADGVSSPVSVG
jgi:hypothetical protein